MQEEKTYRYAVKVTADTRICRELKEGRVTIKYPKNCKKCKRHRNHLLLSKKKKSELSHSHERIGVSGQTQQFYESKSRNRKKDEHKEEDISLVQFRTNANNNDEESGEPRLTLTSPINWQDSPLMSATSDQNMSSTSTEDLVPRIIQRSPSEKPTRDHYTSFSMFTSSQSKYLPSQRQPYIVVNIPSNTFPAVNRSIFDETATDISDAVKCRYCFSTTVEGSVNKSGGLISPCLCDGTSKYVHKSCLEKWLTLRNLSECEICKTKYKTKWVHRPLFSLKFPPIEKRDVFYLFLTLSFYITLIFQFLGAVYVSLMADVIPVMVRVITLFGLSLGMLWFIIGSIALTIVTYTSDYWKNWRFMNRKKVLILESVNRPAKQRDNQPPMLPACTSNSRECPMEELDLSKPVPV